MNTWLFSCGLISALALVSAPASASVGGAPTERHPDCEPGQARIGEAPLASVYGIADALPVSVAGCEGEQWDGQDAEGEGTFDDPRGAAACSGQVLDPAGATYGFALFQCSDPDALAGGDAFHPVGLRAGAQADRESPGSAAVYAGACVWLVACTSAYTGACARATGAQGCRGDGPVGDATVAGYAKDGTPSNLLWHLLTPRCFLSLTGCWIQDGDCTQDEYAKHDHEVPSCGRDNTAITITALA